MSVETGNISLIENTQNTCDKLLTLGFFILIHPFQWSRINQKSIAQSFGDFIHGLLVPLCFAVFWQNIAEITHFQRLSTDRGRFAILDPQTEQKENLRGNASQ